MAFDINRYEMDNNRRNPNAALGDGAVLYRITSDLHSDRSIILSGEGAMFRDGRYNYIRQRTTYCAMSVMVALSEALYYMYRAVLDAVHAGLSPYDLDSMTDDTRHLVVLAVDRIDDLVYVDAAGATLYYPGLQYMTITHPDHRYDPLQKFGTEVSRRRKNGVVFPSARHSEAFAYALFEDQTAKLKSVPYEILKVRLRLVPESHDFTSHLPAPAPPPPALFLDRDRPHPTVGHYEFDDSAAGTTLADLKSQQLINPSDLREKSYIDFVRRLYTDPDKKYIPCC